MIGTKWPKHWSHDIQHVTNMILTNTFSIHSLTRSSTTLIHLNQHLFYLSWLEPKDTVWKVQLLTSMLQESNEWEPTAALPCWRMQDALHILNAEIQLCCQGNKLGRGMLAAECWAESAYPESSPWRSPWSPTDTLRSPLEQLCATQLRV